MTGLLYWISTYKRAARFFERSWLTEIGKHTLGIYIIQSIVLETVMAEYVKVDEYGGVFECLSFDIYILFPVLSFVIMVLCAVCAKIINKNSFLCFYLLGVMRKN